MENRKKYDVMIIGAGPGGIFSAWELRHLCPDLRIAVLEAGHELKKRKCPIGAFSDGKYNITNDFGGTLYRYIGREKALELMHYVDRINTSHGGGGTHMYSTAGTELKKVCMQNKLTLLEASVRHLGTDINYVVLENLYEELLLSVDFYFDTKVESLAKNGEEYLASFEGGSIVAETCIVSAWRFRL